ncbi:hypothetical protein NDU88_000793 [Pleurodeles waltl]|uniref:Uncharacterized protein n=1 Tax=Pleurodeles waltl TaxID=8319 RepID=A0AAV7R7U8_PLEWA|nr:hypothetical protein NDU88_000793 [Pleurodeles waltl]
MRRRSSHPARTEKQSAKGEERSSDTQANLSERRHSTRQSPISPERVYACAELRTRVLRYSSGSLRKLRVADTLRSEVTSGRRRQRGSCTARSAVCGLNGSLGDAALGIGPASAAPRVISAVNGATLTHPELTGAWHTARKEELIFSLKAFCQ